MITVFSKWGEIEIESMQVTEVLEPHLLCRKLESDLSQRKNWNYCQPDIEDINNKLSEKKSI